MLIGTLFGLNIEVCFPNIQHQNEHSDPGDPKLKAMYKVGCENHRVLDSQSTDLVVGPEPSLPGKGSSRARTSGRGTNSMIGGITQEEIVSIFWESNNELLSWGSIVLPVIHGIIL